jgi:zinc/manganese transport system substrate-binding protein
MRHSLTLLAFFAAASLATAQLKVAALHPLLGDLARQVGGDKVQVIDLLKPGGDLHHFEPAGKDLAEMKGVALVLASGKNLESYLDKLRDTLGSIPVIELGKTIPPIKIVIGSDLFLGCPDNEVGGIDPHWWHSAENMKRAARVLADEFIKADPANTTSYKAGAAATIEHLQALKTWAQQQFLSVPKADRKLVTGHSAFAYFCKEYGFKSISILGVSREDDASAAYLDKTLKIIRDNAVRAAFPEDQANPKVLAEIVRETGVKLGDPLVADGTAVKAHTFETMLKWNVTAIVKALAK